jgi:hypothetical protein
LPFVFSSSCALTGRAAARGAAEANAGPAPAGAESRDSCDASVPGEAHPGSEAAITIDG